MGTSRGSCRTTGARLTGPAQPSWASPGVKGLAGRSPAARRAPTALISLKSSQLGEPRPLAAWWCPCHRRPLQPLQSALQGHGPDPGRSHPRSTGRSERRNRALKVPEQALSVPRASVEPRCSGQDCATLPKTAEQRTRHTPYLVFVRLESEYLWYGGRSP